MTKLYEENPSHIKDAEIVVSILSRDKTPGIAFPVEKADQGLVEFFPGRKSVIVSSDYNSENGNREAFMKVKTEVPKIYLSGPKEVKG